MSETIPSLTAANSIDAAADYMVISPASGAYKKINRNVLLGVTGTPADISSVQTITNKTLDATNAITILDGSFTIQHTGGTTKQAVFSLTSITGGNTRTITVPDSNTTLPIISQVVTISGPTTARTYTFPDAAATIVGTAATQTLTNKTITDSTNILGGVTMTLGSDANGDTYYRASGVLTRLAKGTAGQVLTMNGGATAPTWAASTSQVTLLKANSGTDTNAGATNVDTFAISGLTAKDSLQIVGSLYSATQPTTSTALYSSTDSANVVVLNDSANSITAGNTRVFNSTVRQDQNATTVYDSVTMVGQTVYGAGQTNGVVQIYSSVGIATAWTGSWTLALRHGGVTAGGTLRWSWAIYKIAGQ